MSAKNRDSKNRWRNVTIAFRVSPEENDDLNMRVKLSGLSKQEYITRRCQERDIVVMGTPRVYKALKEQIAEIIVQLQAIQEGAEISEILLESIKEIASTIGGMQNCTDGNRVDK